MVETSRIRKLKIALIIESLLSFPAAGIFFATWLGAYSDFLTVVIYSLFSIWVIVVFITRLMFNAERARLHERQIYDAADVATNLLTEGVYTQHGSCMDNQQPLPVQDKPPNPDSQVQQDVSKLSSPHTAQEGIIVNRMLTGMPETSHVSRGYFDSFGVLRRDDHFLEREPTEMEKRILADAEIPLDPPPTPEEVHEAEMNPWPGHTMRETILRNRGQMQAPSGTPPQQQPPQVPNSLPPPPQTPYSPQPQAPLQIPGYLPQPSSSPESTAPLWQETQDNYSTPKPPPEESNYPPPEESRDENPGT